jgi:hypothetical protein
MHKCIYLVRLTALLTFISWILSIYIYIKFVALGLRCFQDCSYYYLNQNTYIAYWLIESFAFLCYFFTLIITVKKWSSIGKGLKVYFLFSLLVIAVLTVINIRYLYEVPIKSYLDFA